MPKPVDPELAAQKIKEVVEAKRKNADAKA